MLSCPPSSVCETAHARTSATFEDTLSKLDASTKEPPKSIFYHDAHFCVLVVEPPHGGDVGSLNVCFSERSNLRQEKGHPKQSRRGTCQKMCGQTRPPSALALVVCACTTKVTWWHPPRPVFLTTTPTMGVRGRLAIQPISAKTMAPMRCAATRARPRAPCAQPEPRRVTGARVCLLQLSRLPPRPARTVIAVAAAAAPCRGRPSRRGAGSCGGSPPVPPHPQLRARRYPAGIPTTCREGTAATLTRAPALHDSPQQVDPPSVAIRQHSRSAKRHTVR